MKTRVDEDYLVCREYRDRIDQKSPEYPDFITFQHPNSNYYFAWINDGEVILRSEAYPDEEKMIRGVKAVLRNREYPERFSIEEHHGAHYFVLWGGDVHQKHTGNFETHNEVGRSCPKKSRQELLALLLFRGRDFANAVVPLHGESLIAEAIAPSVSRAAATEKAGFNWWWALPLLLIPLFFLYRGCRKDAPEPATALPGSTTPSAGVAMQPRPSAVAKGTETPPQPLPTTPAAVAAVDKPAPSCDLNWIFFDFDQFAISPDARGELATMADILKKNGEYTGDLKAYTDSRGSNDYNQRLSRRRADAAKDTLVNLGVDAARIQTSGLSESTPIATNTDDDTGRKYNRRVELRVKDASGREVCNSIPPTVPDTLKQ